MKTSTEGNSSDGRERNRASWTSASALRLLERNNIKYSINASKSAKLSTAKQNQTQPTSYHSPSAGMTVSNSLHSAYRAITSHTAPKMNPLAQDRESGNIGPNR